LIFGLTDGPVSGKKKNHRFGKACRGVGVGEGGVFAEK